MQTFTGLLATDNHQIIPLDTECVFLFGNVLNGAVVGIKFDWADIRKAIGGWVTGVVGVILDIKNRVPFACFSGGVQAEVAR